MVAAILGVALLALRDHLEREVYCDSPIPELEVELKLTAQGAVVLKQFRPRPSR